MNLGFAGLAAVEFVACRNFLSALDHLEVDFEAGLDLGRIRVSPRRRAAASIAAVPAISAIAAIATVATVAAGRAAAAREHAVNRGAVVGEIRDLDGHNTMLLLAAVGLRRVAVALEYRDTLGAKVRIIVAVRSVENSKSAAANERLGDVSTTFG
jgi:hypothetical protein